MAKINNIHNRTLVETGADVHHQEKERGHESPSILCIISSSLLDSNVSPYTPGPPPCSYWKEASIKPKPARVQIHASYSSPSNERLYNLLSSARRQEVKSYFCTLRLLSRQQKKTSTRASTTPAQTVGQTKTTVCCQLTEAPSDCLYSPTLYHRKRS